MSAFAFLSFFSSCFKVFVYLRQQIKKTMKRILLICLSLFALVFTSCKKEETPTNNGTNNNTNNGLSVMDNIAGAYDVQHSIGQTPFGYYASFNMEDLSVSRDSLLFIDKISDDRIKTYGFFNTTGTVNNDRLQFDSLSIVGSVSHPAVGTYTEVEVVAKFENAYYSNGVINLRLHVYMYKTEDNSLYDEYGAKVIAIKH